MARKLTNGCSRPRLSGLLLKRLCKPTSRCLVDGILDGCECGVASNGDAKDVGAVVIGPAELHSQAGGRDVERIKVVLKSRES